MGYREIYEKWRDNPYFDEAFRKELKDLEGNEKEIEDRFYTDLAFGTAGMRGVIGAGRNRMNQYIVRRATQGFANYIKAEGEGPYSVAIAYDSRRKSPAFALETALVMAANGIKAYLFEDLRTTPELSFTLRRLGASAGVIITASHNPPEYNGYKVYGDDGCQLVPDKAERLVRFVEGVASFDEVQRLTAEEAKQKGLLEILGQEADDAYINMVMEKSFHPDLLKETEMKVVYSPLHGTGGMAVTETLKRLGFTHLVPVEEQMVPDSDFTTCKNPNPEELAAFDLGRVYAEREGADVLIATDPDCDRVGVVVRDQEGAYHPLNGNETGALLTDYVLTQMGALPKNPVVITTIVTSDLAKKLCAAHGVHHLATLTGFKFIGEKIRKFESTEDTFIMGYEESYGYLVGTEVRDKDAVSASLLVVEMAAYYHKQGQNLLDRLDALQKEHGYHREGLLAKKLAGKSGMETMKEIMAHFREKGLDQFEVVEAIDYKDSDRTGLPAADVLKFYLEGGSWIAIRPSGTEPKIKFYFSSVDETAKAAEERLETMREAMEKALDNF